MTIQNALEQLILCLPKIYGNSMKSIILYGSTARGTREDDSDVDIALILRANATKEMYDKMLDVVVDLELSCGKVLSVIRIDEERFEVWKDALPFYQNIRKEGVILWQAA